MDVLLDGKGVLSGKGEVFLHASKENNINPVYLISHALLETDHGTSTLADHNNFFGIGAVDLNSILGGIKFARQHGWVTPELGIRGGAEIISKKWINGTSASQSALYAMRWNPISPGTSPQYATDIGWASQQTKLIYQRISMI